MKLFKNALLSIVAVGGLLTGCSDSKNVPQSDVVINGAGASFPAPVYRKWLYIYKQDTGVTVNYQSVGSGAGIRQIKAKTVDFGASDKPLKLEELKESGLIQFPMLMGGVVPVVNIPGIKAGELVLSGDTLAKIFLGKIKSWDDPAVKKENPTLKLPELPITVVHRSDGSGTTWIFTNYLTKASKDWAAGPGTGKALNWPVGIGGQKNPGVANNVLKVKGAIGYVEYTYAVEANMKEVSLINKAGKVVKASMKSFSAAGVNADWDNAPGFYIVLTNQPGNDSWPITGVTYILLHKNQDNKKMCNEMLKYFTFCYRNGQKVATDMNYVAIPEAVVNKVFAKWESEIVFK